METRRVIRRIAPWPAAKLAAVMYFALGVLAGVPMALLSWLAPPAPDQPGPVFFLMMPVIYALAGLIFIPLGCWIYNRAAALVGGLELEIGSGVGNG
jgi:hypothetical protein